MKYYLFSAYNRCQPCRALVDMLEKSELPWREKIEYVDVDKMNEEQALLAKKLEIFRIPTFSNQDEVIPAKFSMDIFRKIKEICTSE